MDRKLELTIVEGKPEISLTNLDTGQALALLEAGIRVLTNRELIHMGCDSVGAKVNRNTSDEEIKNIQEQFPKDPIAKTMSDLVTPKQLVAIRAIANAGGLNAGNECMSHPQLKCRVEELSRKAASGFIDHLKQRATDENLERSKNVG